MTEELNFQVYLGISTKKFEIYLLDKKKLKNIYSEEIQIENDTNRIDYNLLNTFLENNIFKIEKLIGNFLKNITVIIENTKILSFSFGIKKKNFGEKINRQYLKSSLIELKDIFKENYQNNKILHFVINKCAVNGVNHNSFDNEIEGDHMIVEASFISIPNIFIEEISDALEKYQIKIDRFLNLKYIKDFFSQKPSDLSIIAFKIQSGLNENEIDLVPKSHKKKGFFEKFFQFFN